MDGYVKLYRSVNDWQWKTEPLTLAVFVHLLTNAAFKAHKWKDIELQPGQLLIGREQISLATGVSEQSVRTALTRLKSTSSITIESTNQGSLVTIINWAIYQGGDEISTSELTSTQPATNQRPTSDQPAINQRSTTTEECKEGKERKKGKKGNLVGMPPTIEEVIGYFFEIGCAAPDEPQKYYDHYCANGWMAGKVPMRDWKSAARNWKRNALTYTQTRPAQGNKAHYNPFPAMVKEMEQQEREAAYEQD